MPYDAFISYSHAGDGRLAPAVQAGLERLTKSWWRRRALHVFRDETGLGVDPQLWRSIQTALDDSSWFVLLASPEAAASRWVNKEVEYWLTSKPADRVLTVLTGGTMEWDEDTNDFTAESTAIPPVLRSRYTEEPRYLDLRWARSEDELDLRHPRFKSALATLGAPLHGVTPADLEVKDVRNQRRVARGATAALAVLAVSAVVFATFAINIAAQSRRSAVRARHEQEIADVQRGIALTQRGIALVAKKHAVDSLDASRQISAKLTGALQQIAVLKAQMQQYRPAATRGG